MDLLSELPRDVLANIFSFLKLEDRLNCKLVCRSWRDTALEGRWRTDLTFYRQFLTTRQRHRNWTRFLRQLPPGASIDRIRITSRVDDIGRVCAWIRQWHGQDAWMAHAQRRLTLGHLHVELFLPRLEPMTVAEMSRTVSSLVADSFEKPYLDDPLLGTTSDTELRTLRGRTRPASSSLPWLLRDVLAASFATVSLSLPAHVVSEPWVLYTLARSLPHLMRIEIDAERSVRISSALTLCTSLESITVRTMALLRSSRAPVLDILPTRDDRDKWNLSRPTEYPLPIAPPTPDYASSSEATTQPPRFSAHAAAFHPSHDASQTATHSSSLFHDNPNNCIPPPPSLPPPLPPPMDLPHDWTQLARLRSVTTDLPISDSLWGLLPLLPSLKHLETTLDARHNAPINILSAAPQLTALTSLRLSFSCDPLEGLSPGGTIPQYIEAIGRIQTLQQVELIVQNWLIARRKYSMWRPRPDVVEETEVSGGHRPASMSPFPQYQAHQLHLSLANGIFYTTQRLDNDEEADVPVNWAMDDALRRRYSIDKQPLQPADLILHRIHDTQSSSESTARVYAWRSDEASLEDLFRKLPARLALTRYQVRLEMATWYNFSSIKKVKKKDLVGNCFETILIPSHDEVLEPLVSMDVTYTARKGGVLGQRMALASPLLLDLSVGERSRPLHRIAHRYMNIELSPPPLVPMSLTLPLPCLPGEMEIKMREGVGVQLQALMRGPAAPSARAREAVPLFMTKRLARQAAPLGDAKVMRRFLSGNSVAHKLQACSID